MQFLADNRMNGHETIFTEDSRVFVGSNCLTTRCFVFSAVAMIFSYVQNYDTEMRRN